MGQLCLGKELWRQETFMKMRLSFPSGFNCEGVFHDQHRGKCSQHELEVSACLPTWQQGFSSLNLFTLHCLMPCYETTLESRGMREFVVGFH